MLTRTTKAKASLCESSLVWFTDFLVTICVFLDINLISDFVSSQTDISADMFESPLVRDPVKTFLVAARGFTELNWYIFSEICLIGSTLMLSGAGDRITERKLIF